MSSAESSATTTSIDDSDRFTLIDPETGISMARRAPADDADTREDHSRVSGLSRSTWSVPASAAAASRVHGESEAAAPPSLRELPASPTAQSPSLFSEICCVESASPSYAEQRPEELVEREANFPSMVSTGRKVDNNNNNNPVDNVNLAAAPLTSQSLPGTLEEVSPCKPSASKNDKRSSVNSASSKEEICVQNAVLRAQLAEADKKAVHHIHLHEKCQEELNNMHQTLSLLFHSKDEKEYPGCLGARASQVKREQERLREHERHPLMERPNWFQQVFRVMGLEHMFLPPVHHRHSRCGRRRARRNVFAFEGDDMEFGWKRDFSSAKWHARHGRARLATEALLRAISSDGFDAWRSLLVEESEWNRLSGPERRQWDYLVAVKISKLLDTNNSRNNKVAIGELVSESRGGTCPSEKDVDGESNESGGKEEDARVGVGMTGGNVGGQHPFTVDVLIPFIRRLSWSYAEKHTCHKVAPQTASEDGASLGEIIGPSSEIIGEALEDLLSASIAAFPGSASLLYLLASVRAIQSREEESLGLLAEVVRLDRSYLLSVGSVYNC